MKKILMLICVFLISANVNGQDNFVKKFLKYSTVFGSYSESSPLFEPERYFVTQGGDLINVSPEISNDYLVTFGIRKIARWDYEYKESKYYSGNEKLSLNANGSSIKGLEYLFQYSKGKQQNREFENERYFVRYSGKYWSTKLELQNNGLINLNYKSADLRFRVPIKKLSLSAGLNLRTHKPFGFLPIDEYLENNAWWDLAYSEGFVDYYYGIDYDNDGVLDNFDWYWLNPEGERVADTDADFRRNIYQSIVNEFNKRELDKIGTLGTLSFVVGGSFYHYRDKFHLHSWFNVMPYHEHVIGDHNYSYELYVDKKDWLDYNVGLNTGWDVSRKIGIFAEYELTKFWDKRLSYLKVGLNYKL